ncbi:hypothetical protein BDN67DRAFT_991794 [Paxillus ammoniavirescens]|nr:hypothetical protein BDN67DRAFT_991794 [Paxillus ammoniavirescens]
MGRHGNGVSLEDIARFAGCSEGAVEKYTERCFAALKSFHNAFVHLSTGKEKEQEKCWIDEYLGFMGMWWEGWYAYFTRKSNYGLNLQVRNLPSNLCIVDYSHGMTGFAHDAWALEHIAAAKHSDRFFKRDEFTWADSAYALTTQTIPIHKKPASFLPENTIFDQAVANLCVHLEHCMGLRVNINSKHQHIAACYWITITIVLHKIIIGVEGEQRGAYFAINHGQAQEEEDQGPSDEPLPRANMGDGGAKRGRLVEELVAFCNM